LVAGNSERLLLLTCSRMWFLSVGDGDTDQADLGLLLADWGCGT